jgi:hypothetical protein
MSTAGLKLEYRLYPERGFFLHERPLRAGDRVEWRSPFLSDGWTEGHFDIFDEIPVVRFGGRGLSTVRADQIELQWPALHSQRGPV